MIKRIKNFLLKYLLKIIFLQEITVETKNKSEVLVYVIVSLKDKIFLVKENDFYNIASSKIDMQNKESISDKAREILLKEFFQDLTCVKGMSFFDSYREIVTKDRGNQIKDHIFLKVDIDEEVVSRKLKKDCISLALEELKIECFKNRFNLYDYRLLIRAILKDN